MSFFCVSCGCSLARRKNDFCLLASCSFANYLVTGGRYSKAKNPLQTPKKPTKTMPPKPLTNTVSSLLYVFHVCALDLSFSKLAYSVCIFSWWKLKLERFHMLTVAATRRSWKFSFWCIFFLWFHKVNLTQKEPSLVSLLVAFLISLAQTPQLCKKKAKKIPLCVFSALGERVGPRRD